MWDRPGLIELKQDAIPAIVRKHRPIHSSVERIHLGPPHSTSKVVGIAGTSGDDDDLRRHRGRLRGRSSERLRLRRLSNELVGAIAPLKILANPYWVGFGTDGNGTYYRPLTVLSFALDRALYGSSAWGFHLTNVFLHALAGCLVFALVQTLVRSRSAGLAAALVTVVHPVNTEAVAHVSARGDLLVAIFVIAGVREVLRRRPRVWAIALSVLGALVSKESGLVLPILLVWVDVIWCPTRESLHHYALRRIRRVHVWSAVSVLAWLALRWNATGSLAHVRPSPLDNPLIVESTLTALFTLPHQLFEYARLLVYPASLSVDYGFAQLPVVESPDPMLVVLAVAVVLCGRLLRSTLQNAPALSLAIGILLLPILLVTNPLLPAGSMVAERYLYLSTIGLATVVAYSGHRFRPVWPAALSKPPVRWAALSIVLAAAGVRTDQRVDDWQSDETLFASAVEASPRSIRSHINYAHTLSKRGDYLAASAVLTRAIAVAPPMPILHLRLADALRHTGRNDAALVQYKNAARLNPNVVEAWVGVGNTALALNRDAEAERVLERAVAMLPGSFETLNQLGIAYHRRGKFPDAQNAYRSAIHENGRSAHVYFNLGVALASDNKPVEAAEAFENAVSLQPTLLPAHRYLAQLFDGMGDPERAERHRRAFGALTGQPSSPDGRTSSGPPS